MFLLVMLMAFGFFGIAALSIDLGIARLARNQMQDAADTAAIEGARAAASPDQRELARDFVSQALAGTGAGPNTTLSGGSGGFAFSAGLTPGEPPVYSPALELNAANEPHGDLVSGNFTGGVPEETAAYERSDFAPDSAGRAFLVRLRRTPDRQGLDRIPDVSSAGAPLPLLFGQGSLYMGVMRSEGVTVRATAIAESLPAVSVHSLPGYPGLTSFALSASFYSLFRSGLPPTAVSIDANGLITPLGGGLAVGRFVVPASSIGLELPAILPPPDAVLSGYAPLYQQSGPASVERTVGFGYVSLGGTTGTVSISASPGRSDRNLGNALPAVPPIPAGEWIEVVAANRALGSAARPSLMR